MKAAFAVCLLACGALWGWALYWPKPPPPLPEGLAGEFVLFRFEPPPEQVMDNPYPIGQRRLFEFRDDGTYMVHIHVSGGYEMMREQGTVEIEGDRLLLTQISFNGVLVNASSPVRYRWSWRGDREGAYLLLTGDPVPYELYLRPVDRKASSAR